jgi:hypothetical protein
MPVIPRVKAQMTRPKQVRGQKPPVATTANKDKNMRIATITFLILASLALGAALGPAKTCSTGVAEEDPTAVRVGCVARIYHRAMILRDLLHESLAALPSSTRRRHGRMRAWRFLLLCFHVFSFFFSTPSSMRVSRANFARLTARFLTPVRAQKMTTFHAHHRRARLSLLVPALHPF